MVHQVVQDASYPYAAVSGRTSSSSLLSTTFPAEWREFIGARAPNEASILHEYHFLLEAEGQNINEIRTEVFSLLYTKLTVSIKLTSNKLTT